MEFQKGLVTFVHIVILQFVLIQQQLTHTDRILAEIVYHFSQHDTLHRKVNRLFRAITLNRGHLVEMPQLQGIVSHLDGKLISSAYLLGELDSRTATIWFYTFDMQLAPSFILQFEGCRNRLVKARTTAIYSGVVHTEFLC